MFVAVGGEAVCPICPLCPDKGGGCSAQQCTPRLISHLTGQPPHMCTILYHTDFSACLARTMLLQRCPMAVSRLAPGRAFATAAAHGKSLAEAFSAAKLKNTLLPFGSALDEAAVRELTLDSAYQCQA